jgi:hypothetical protein
MSYLNDDDDDVTVVATYRLFRATVEPDSAYPGQDVYGYRVERYVGNDYGRDFWAEETSHGGFHGWAHARVQATEALFAMVSRWKRDMAWSK